jgi:CII-binding regulator of phage lambda lysogenization HflD
MTEKGYMSDIYKQLEEVMHKCDSLSSDITLLKKENKNLKKLHKEEIKTLTVKYENRISSLEKTIEKKIKKSKS